MNDDLAKQLASYLGKPSTAADVTPDPPPASAVASVEAKPALPVAGDDPPATAVPSAPAEAPSAAGLQRQSSEPKRVRGRPFVKGQSGNPLGKRKGAVSLSATLKRVLTREDCEQVARKIIEQAKGGDAKAQRLLLDRIDGPVVFRGQHEITGADGEPFQPRFDLSDSTRSILEVMRHRWELERRAEDSPELARLLGIEREDSAEASDPESGNGRDRLRGLL